MIHSDIRLLRLYLVTGNCHSVAIHMAISAAAVVEAPTAIAMNLSIYLIVFIGCLDLIITAMWS